MDVLDEATAEDAGSVHSGERPVDNAPAGMLASPSSEQQPSRVPDAELPPSPEQIIEAMLFVGGHPLAAEVACAAVRGLTPERFQLAIDTLNRRYREQWRALRYRDTRGWLRAARPACLPQSPRTVIRRPA